ncbi:DNA polymerase III subunit delta [Corynebacterium halotolerans]|uniref:DNA polymerase III subunit delta n=1 Tax=Corynebacterium halotolerans TaxID=225326 RepID=UPI003CE6D5E4
MSNTVAPVHLIEGGEEFLAERAKNAIITQVRAASPEGEALPVTTMRAGEITGSELLELLSPSLFGEDRVIVLTNTDEAGKEPAELLLKTALDPAPGIFLIIMHSGGGRTKQLVPKFRKVAGQVHEAQELKDRERPRWVTSEFRSHGVQVTPDVVHALLEGVGSDLRELASAVSQLVSDTDGNVTAATVREYYAGVAEVSGFDIADLAVAGQLDRAVASTRRALQLGTSPVALAAALSAKVGAIARLYTSRGSDSRRLAGTLGMHPFVVEKTTKVARGWNGEAVSDAVILVAELDAAVKGQGGDQNYEIEAAVRKIAELAQK